MEAKVGDRLVVKSHHVGDPNREAVVLEVHGQHGAAPYTVRWNDGHESVFFPSSDCSVM
jgi:Domain of unknown function (DUF1918)